MDVRPLIGGLKGKLIVSCQAREESPLFGPVFMAAMAAAAEQAGAAGIRANGAVDIAAIRHRVRLPIIGIEKQIDPRTGAEIITPDFASARRVAEAGADIVALSCAACQRPDPEALGELIQRIRLELKVLVMADCATLEEGVLAARLGADLVASTLSGYTPETAVLPTAGPDLALVEALVRAQPKPVVAEGRIWTPEQARAALAAGAHAVVVGTAITNPVEITARFLAVMR
ncbi:MAG: N-acetylmannosamine-6-phosphate 2-epimerase [Bacillota bacterium]